MNWSSSWGQAERERHNRARLCFAVNAVEGVLDSRSVVTGSRRRCPKTAQLGAESTELRKCAREWVSHTARAHPLAAASGLGSLPTDQPFAGPQAHHARAFASAEQREPAQIYPDGVPS